MSASLVTTLQYELCVRPVKFNVESFEPSSEESKKIFKEIEWVCLYLLVGVVDQYFFRYTTFEALLTIKPKNVEYEDDSTHETSYIGKEGINFIETSFNFRAGCRFKKENLCKVGSTWEIGCLMKILCDSSDIFFMPVFPGHDTLVSLYTVLSDVAVSISANWWIEEKNVLIFKVKLFIILITWVYESVHHGKK